MADTGRTTQNGGNETAFLWHSLQGQEALAALDASTAGLTDAEAEVRRGRYGRNEIARSSGISPLRLFMRQINNPLLYVLLGSGALAIVMGRVVDGLTVLAVVLLNAVIGFVQEYRAGKAIEALSELVPETATVIRNGVRTTTDVADLVPGDIVTFQSGDKVPADVRILEYRNLSVNESTLTGESLPVQKLSDTLPAKLPLADRINMAYYGTFVTTGTATVVVCETGDRTELGRISSMIARAGDMQTPLTRKMEAVAKGLTVIIVAISLLLFGIGLLRGYPLVDATLAAITMAVAAIPEGLPAIITIAMAIGVHRMAARRAIIRHLPAVETLGSTTVICSDKTGTLTKNEMVVQDLWTPMGGEYRLSGIGYAPVGQLLQKAELADGCPEEVRRLLLGGVLCNDATLAYNAPLWSIQGDPTEAAMVVAASKCGLQPEEERRAWKRVDTIPFESDRRFMATLNHHTSGDQWVFLKGAPEVVLPRCTNSSPEVLAAAKDQITAMAGNGLRVLAIAARRGGVAADQLDSNDLSGGLELLGCQGMIDPPRQEAIESVGTCRLAGITVKMITGDHPQTAAAIGGQLGLTTDAEALTGEQIDRLSDEELDTAVDAVGVFARVAPEHKLRLVQALQARGHVVAMTGDGVNDAPALKQADIGIAMGIGGTAVSKEAADMVLADDNFASIAAAVEEGRRVYDNLIKALSFVLPTNLGEGLIVLLAVAFFPLVNGIPLMPILPIQILWINLVAAVGLALPLAFEAKEPDVMRRPPRQPQEPIFSRFVIVRTTFIALLMTVGSLGLFLYEFHLGGDANTGQALREAQTMAITTMVLFQVFYLFTCRSLRESILSIGLWTNKTVFVGVAAIVALQVLFVNLPAMNALFGSLPLSLLGWLEAIVVAMSVIPAIALEKFIWRKIESRRQP